MLLIRITRRGLTLICIGGKVKNDPLLPNIARKNPSSDTTDKERRMLDDLKRRSPLLISRRFENDWEWLVLAQHFGLKTRLLDWTSNPLIAMWFACSNEFKSKMNSFVYFLSTNDSILVDIEKNKSPFSNQSTKILRPSLNNERIIAQSGWFTAHSYSSTAGKYVTLETNSKTKKMLTEVEIPSSLKKDILKSLSVLGVNSRTIFPDVEGLCKHLNWKYEM